LNNAKADDPVGFQTQVQAICDLYEAAPLLAAQGIHLISTDEKTGIQALERKYPTNLAQPGLIERREYEYIRHGTLALIANFEVATGLILSPTLGPTRTEADFASHIAQTIATDPNGCWVFVLDQLNTHMSESLVRLVAAHCCPDQDLGVKEQSGSLLSMVSRKTFLETHFHRIRFVYTPTHCSWLNQVEIWFSILVRRLLKRGSFRSIDDLRLALLAFIDFFNKTMAKPFKWTYAGRPLVA
jgi:hypothetical protein